MGFSVPAVLGLLVLAAWLLLRGFGRRPTLSALALAAALFVGLAVLTVVRAPSKVDAALLRAAPASVPRDGYVGSGKCRSCHPGEYQSWHRSYHRSMTELPSPRSVQANWDASLEFAGRAYTLERRGAEFWVQLPDLDLAAAQAQRSKLDWESVPSVERRIALVTGSHHYQAFWVAGRRGNELRQLPFVFHLGERRWLARNDAFLQPPDAELAFTRWNSNCIQCHAVAGRPSHDLERDVFQSEVIELGIACEACHGPAARHVNKHQNPLVRYQAERTSHPAGADDSIIQPSALAPEHAAQVCGQCHAYFVPVDEAAWWEHGFATSFSAGGELEASRRVLFLDDEWARQVPSLRAELDSVFWPDGTMRVGGREYNGLLLSACYTRGQAERKLTCTHCHSMHDAEPDDQLKVEAKRDEVCLSCHESLRGGVAQHSRHARGSELSCYDCHMPLTSYALLKGIRSHRITSPSVRNELSGGPPNACNLCHLDRSLAWTAQRLNAWYGQGALDLLAPEVPEPVSKLLSGDAAERVVMAYAAGQVADSGRFRAGWLRPVLAQLLTDPYAAVRWVAWDSLRRLGASGVGAVDPHGPSADRAAARRAIQARREDAPASVRGLFSEHGRVDQGLLVDLTGQRDDRPISISE